MSISPEIGLDSVETSLKTLLLDVANHIDGSKSTPGHHDKTILRFTGGWVRDKLLQQSSHDIDVSINNMTGYQFGLELEKYVKVPSNAAKYGHVAMHTIAANPEKSKHLETVTTRLLGLDIDLVNLRKETYSDKSRNPQMDFGTPLEDALRRDATINALFYNVNTGQVEDFTGRGIDDMKAKLIRTPLEPYQTFKDDPLRVLRLIRFSSRLGFTLDLSVETAMQDPSIKAALKNKDKISRERVGVELEKMLRGSDPHTAIALIHRNGLYDTVFVDPEKENQHSDAPHSEELLDIASSLQAFLNDADNNASKTLIASPDDLYLSWLLACIVPYRDAFVTADEAESKKLPLPIATVVVREGIKGTTKVCNLVTAAVRNRQSITNMVSLFPDTKNTPRDEIGMHIRRWGPTWRLQAVFALLSDLADDPQSSATIVAKYTHLINHVVHLGLVEAYDLKPLVDGKALAKALETKPGPWMRDALDVVMAWQLRNPNNMDAAEVIDQIRTSRSDGELATNLIDHILRLTIRPLFAKDHHPSVTAQGRKVTTHVLPRKLHLEDPDEVAKPWKNPESCALSLLGWVVRTITPQLVERYWSNLIPPLLSIIDDTAVQHKIAGCDLLRSLLVVTPPPLLAKTGTTNVFQEAIMPCLLYLPSLTPIDESTALLSSAYSTLFSLMNVAYPAANQAEFQRTAFLERILRDGILTAHAHCPHDIQITKLLFNNTCIVLNTLGIESVRHIKYILPMLNDTLSHPLGTRDPTTLLAAVKVMQSLLLNTWPRLAANRGEVLRGLCFCWKRLLDAKLQDQQTETVKAELRETVIMLKEAVCDSCDFDAECHTLVKADADLEGLFLGSLA